MMAKKNRGKGGKAPHANGVEEVMQKVREIAREFGVIV